MFGEHNSCHISWCGYLQRLGPNLPLTQPYKHSVLKNGKHLDEIKTGALRTGVVKIMSRFANNAEKLAPEGSSQSTSP